MENKIRYLLISFILFFSFIYSSEFISKFSVPIYCNIVSGLGYDNNFLKLSNNELNELSYYPDILGDSKHSFTLVLKNSFNIKINPQFFPNKETIIKYKLDYNRFFSSLDKSYYKNQINFSQKLGNYRWVKFNYSFMPKYYLRMYRDKDKNIINLNNQGLLEKCTFSQENITILYSNKLFFKRTWWEGKLDYATQYYNANFTEFNLNIYSGGLSLFSKYFKKYYFSFKFLFSIANNISYNNGLYSTKMIDRSYNQSIYSISLAKKKIKQKLFQEISSKYTMIVRQYTAVDNIDVLHHFRLHRDHQINLSISGKIFHNLKYKLSTMSRFRKTNSQYQWVESLKDFNKMEYNILLSYYFVSDILY